VLVVLLQQQQQIAVAVAPVSPGAGMPFGGGGKSLAKWLEKQKRLDKRRKKLEDDEDELITLMML